jgi:hypothetical protein
VGSNPAEGMAVSYECLASDIGLCDGLIPRPEESYRVCVYIYVCVCVCVSLSVIRGNNDHLHLHLYLQRVGRRRQTKIEEDRKRC